MHEIGRIVGAILLTYFVSRATLRLPLPLPHPYSAIVAHALSFAAIALVIVMLRQPIGAFALTQLAVYVLPQALWLAIDLLRGPRRRGGSRGSIREA